jgi:putative ABC transport system permease protein
MRYALQVAWRNIRSRPVQTFIPSLVIALAIALTLTVSMLADGTKEGIIESSDPFGVLVVGANGSTQQLVLNTILLQDDPVGNISYEIYEELEADDARVQLAVPLAFGDNVSGARVIGTNHDFFELRRAQNEPPAFQLAEGRLFTEVEVHHDEDEHRDDEHSEEEGEHADEDEHQDDEHSEEEGEHADEDEHQDDEHAVHEGEEEGHAHDENLFEAVLGSRAAEDLDLGIGDHFQTIHGHGTGIASDRHAEVYTVVGILEPSDTPYDGAVLTQLASIWDVHAHDPEDPLSQYIATDFAAAEDQVTAVLVLPASFVGQNQIAQEFQNRSDAQVAYPGEELVALFDLIDQAQEILNIVGYLVLGIAALTVFLAMYNATIQRQQSIAVMRSLGGSRLTVFQIILFETLMVVLIGAIAGRVIGYAAAYLIAQEMESQSFVPVPLRFLPEWELLLWVLPLAVGALAGLLPAVLAYRVNVADKLFAT